MIVVVVWFGIHHDNDDSSRLSNVCDRSIEYPVASLVIIIKAILLYIPSFRFGCRPLENNGCLGTK